MTNKSYWLFFCLLLINSSAFSKNTQQLNLATTNWCPYTCSFEQYQFGAIGHYIKEILAAEDIEVTIESFPWSRAIKLANNKAVSGLLTSTPQEAPNLLFTTVPISTYQVCFYTRKDSQWTYKPSLNIDDRILGIIQDYGYGKPIDSFVAEAENKNNIIAISGSSGVQRLVNMLLNKRVDIIVEDSLVIATEFPQKKNQIKQSGCLPETPFYLSLTDTPEHRKLLPKIDSILAAKHNISKLEKLFTSLTISADYQ